MRSPLVALTLLGAALLAAPAQAQLVGVVNEDGLISVSVDANGDNNAGGGFLDVDKPNAGATVRAAYMAAASNFSYAITNTDVTLAGTPVTWTQSVFNNAGGQPGFFNNVFADVTSIVAPIVDAAPAGIVQLAVTEGGSTAQIDGTVLAVVFDDPAVTESSGAILLFGGQDTTGDQFTISLASPLDLSDPNATATMGLGISFGFQGTSGTSMISEIDVNGTRMTSSAGGEDDGGPFNGGLITVGGLGDSIANPLDPLAGSSGFDTDDDLYDLLPFVSTGDTQIVVDTLNPSDDDNIFFGYFLTSVPISVDDETIFLGPLTAEQALGCDHTVTATVTDAATQTPIAGRTVTFTVTTGPNAGVTGNGVTDASGEATFTYAGSGGLGTDSVDAEMVDSSGNTVFSNAASVDWVGLRAVAYCFGDSGCPCGNDSTAGGCENGSGQGAVLAASGSGSAAADDLVLTCTGMAQGRFAFVYMGPEQANMPFGDGLRCVGPGAPVGLYRYPVGMTGATGTLTLGPGIIAQSQSFPAAGMIQLCQTWNFQAVFRDDPGAQCNTGWNTSNAVGITFGL